MVVKIYGTRCAVLDYFPARFPLLHAPVCCKGRCMEMYFLSRMLHFCDRADRRVTNIVNPLRFIANSQRDDGLHRALAERARADERRALMIL